MAEEDEDGAAAEGTNKKKLIILIVAGVVVLIGATVGITLMLVGGGDESAADADTEEVVVEERGDPNYIDLKPAFTVNLDPQDPVQFLQISIQVLTFDSDVAEDIEKHKPLIRNNLLVLFGQQKSADLRSVAGKQTLQQEVLDIVQSVINEQGSGGEVDSVFFTNFVMQ